MPDKQPDYFSPRLIDLEIDPSTAVLADYLALLGNITLALMLLCYFFSSRSRGYNTFVLTGVCLNISWELYYAMALEKLPPYLFIWLALDLLVLRQALRTGTQQLKWPKHIRKYFQTFFLFFLALAIAQQAGYHQAFPNTAFFLSPWIINLATSTAFCFYYLTFPERERHPKLGILLRLLGTALIAAANFKQFGLIPPIGPPRWIFHMSLGAIILDLVYLGMVQFRFFQVPKTSSGSHEET